MNSILDLGLALDTAAADTIPLPIIGLVRQHYAEALVEGRGDNDYSSIAAMIEKRAGTKLSQ